MISIGMCRGNRSGSTMRFLEYVKYSTRPNIAGDNLHLMWYNLLQKSYIQSRSRLKNHSDELIVSKTE